jgi:hypothetical protein
MKYWADCPYDVVLSTDTKSEYLYSYSNVVESTHTGNWTRLKETLKTISTPYVFLLLDDYWLIDNVNNDKLDTLLNYSKKYQVGNLRFIAKWCASKVFNEAEMLRICEIGAYRISLQGGGIWDKQYLETLVGHYDNMWAFEREGSFNEDSFKKPILVTEYQEFPCIDAVQKGKYEPFAEIIMNINHIETGSLKRQVMTNRDVIKKHLKGAIIDINPSLVVRTQNLLNIGFKLR